MNPLQTQARAQLGGTLLGFVSGVLLGLAAALAVAVYVTNVPVPFMDHGVTRKPAQDAAEAEHNKGWNPNAGLVGKQDPLPAPTSDGQAGSGPTLLAPGPDPESSPTQSLGNDPLGDLVRSKLGDETPTAPAPGPATATATAPVNAQVQPFVYFVQVGAFRAVEDANAQRAKVALMGMASQVTEREQAGRQVFRVRLGPFNQLNLAEATREQLIGRGMDATLVRVER
jgi:cell division protein FtsN